MNIKAKKEASWLLYLCAFTCLVVILLVVVGLVTPDTAKTVVELLVKTSELL